MKRVYRRRRRNLLCMIGLHEWVTYYPNVHSARKACNRIGCPVVKTLW